MSRVIKKLMPYMDINEIFSVFHEEKDAVYLDSSLKNDKGQYSIIGLHPYLSIVKSEKLLVNNQEFDMSFEDYMRNYLKENYDENFTNLPIISGAIGYLSYDYGRELEKVASVQEGDKSIPHCIFNFYDNFIIENHEKKEIYLVANGNLMDCENSIRSLEDSIMTKGKNTLKGKKYDSPEVKVDFKKEEYLETIDKMIKYIIDGDIYIANLTQTLRINSQKEPYVAFQKLRAINPSPFGAYMNYGEFQIVSASPERFLRMKENHVETRPIKGTRKRGATPFEDMALKEELQQSEKDKSELLMIVDLERNDLNKVCKEGSVKVTEIFTVEEYATVFHLVANIIGELKKDLTVMDLILAAFPGGSITGAPKLRAMEIIDELERGKRGIYTGSIGYISLDGNCDLNIVIRTALHKNGLYTLGVGGGITYSSETEFEYDETIQKAKAIVEALH